MQCRFLLARRRNIAAAGIAPHPQGCEMWALHGLGRLANCGQLWPRLGNAQDRARQLGLFGLAGEASRSGGAQAAPCALSQENKLLEGRPVPGSDISVALPLSLSLLLQQRNVRFFTIIESIPFQEPNKK